TRSKRDWSSDVCSSDLFLCVLGAFLYFLDRRDGFLEGPLAAQNITDSVFFASRGVLAHKRGGIAKLLVRLVLAVHESGEDVDLGGQRFIVEEEREDLRGGRVAVTIRWN